jgi:regulator of sirC expression with transglutaminase-like and TPR domain
MANFDFSVFDPGLDALGLIDDADLLLDEAALQIGAADQPGVDLAPIRQQLAAMTAELGTFGAGFAGALHRARMLIEVIANGAAMHGDTEDYDNPANADFLALFRRRRGLPVTLAILYVALARRIGWQAAPVNLPGHVLVRIGRGPDSVLIDAFDGGKPIDAIALAALVARIGGGTPAPAHLRSLGNRATLVRLVSNQATRARALGDVARALVLHERMTAFAPGFTALWWERARLEQLQGQVPAARASLAAMMETTHDAAVRDRIGKALAALTI